MKTSFPGDSLAWGIRGLTLLTAVLSPQTGALGLALLLLALGIPHGAADHLIFRSRHPGGSTFPVVPFVTFYAGIVGGYTLLWWWLPDLALGIFLAVSVYHFGQPHGRHLGERILWGSFALGFPVLYHFPQAEPIISGMLGHAVVLPDGWTLGIPVLLVAANLSLALLTGQRDKAVDTLVLTLAYLCTDLLLGFAIFFLLWHSLPALVEQWRYLTRHRLTGGWASYLGQLLPLTAGAFVAMAIAFAFLYGRGDHMPDLSYLFIMVSLITLPHALLVDRIYR